VEAAGLLRLLYEKTYGIHVRAEQHQVAVAEAALARRYVDAKRHIPIDPDYTPE
jgi:hypothetical protein